MQDFFHQQYVSNFFLSHPTYANPRPPEKICVFPLGGCGLRRNFMPWSCVKMPMSFNGLLNKRCAMSGFNEKNRLGGFTYFFFSPIFWGRGTHFDEHIFQRGWNHQLEKKVDHKDHLPSTKPTNRHGKFPPFPGRYHQDGGCSIKNFGRPKSL